jgi:hypothetical protein
LTDGNTTAAGATGRKKLQTVRRITSEISRDVRLTNQERAYSLDSAAISDIHRCATPSGALPSATQRHLPAMSILQPPGASRRQCSSPVPIRAAKVNPAPARNGAGAP